MNIKLILSSIRWDRDMITLLEELQQTNREKLLPKGVRYDKSVVQTSGSGDLIDRIVEENMKLDREIQRYKLEMIRQQEQALQLIRSLESPQERLILQLYYMSTRTITFRAIAARMNYSEKQIRRLHDQALEKLEAADRETCPPMSG